MSCIVQALHSVGVLKSGPLEDMRGAQDALQVSDRNAQGTLQMGAHIAPAISATSCLTMGQTV